MKGINLAGGQPWGPLEAEGRPVGQDDYKIAYKSTFEPISGLRHYSSWIRLVFYADSCRRFVVWLCKSPFHDRFCSP